MRKKERKKNKGFTLVELIVVLVILAILAAILVPALLGYIDSARNKQTLLNARSAMTAAQAELSAIYGSNSAVPSDIRPSADASKPSVHNKHLLETADIEKLLPEVQLFEVACWKNYPDSMPSDRTRKDYHEAFVVCWIHYKDSSSEIWYNGESGEWSETSVTRPLVEGSTKEVEKYTVYEKK